ncbi:MAG TPA: SNF2-related protein, partial [Vicinamibacterales bacterium]|nr:SNF2-related protein [Vicinamibacterales bacterium]
MSGAVRDLGLDAGAIVATVVGSEGYDITLEPDNTFLRASCTCPFFFDRNEICKHIWATILAAEARNLPLTAPGTPPSLVILEPDQPDVDAVDDEAFVRSFAANTWTPRPPAPRPERRQPQPRPGPPPPWRQLLDAVAAPPAVAPVTARNHLAPGQLVYVIDVAATLGAGALVLELMTRDRKVNGDWGKPKPVHVSTADVRSLPDSSDRQIVERLQGARPHLEYGGYYGYEVASGLSRVRLSGVLLREVLPLVCATGRGLARVAAADASRPDPGGRRWDSFRKPDPPALLPIAWDDGAPWRFEIAIRRNDVKREYTIEGSLIRDTSRMAVTEPLVVLADGVLITRTHAARLDHADAFVWLAALRRIGSVTVPYESRSALLTALLTQSAPIAAAPDELRVEIVDAEPTPRLRLQPTPRRDRLNAELSFGYDGVVVPSESQDTFVRAGDSNRAVRRHLDGERRHAATLHGLGCRMDWDFNGRQQVLQLPTMHAPRAIQTLLAEGWHVEAAEGVYRKPGAVSVKVSSGIDWFDLDSAVDYGGVTAPLPTLLAALERGDAYVRLDDGSVGLLPEEWLRKHGIIARLGAAEGDHIRFKHSQVALLDALLDAQPQATWDEAYARARSELQRFDGIRPLDPSPAFAGTLREYQREGLGWLTFLQRFGFGGCLADDMGLGKTVMVLALLDLRRDLQPDGDRRPSLVVAPRSVV